MPPLPPWAGLHPLVIHFPIALLLVAPLPIVVGLLVLKWRTACGLMALGLMAVGTVSAYLSVATGEAAGELAERSPGINAVLEEHEEGAELLQWVFSGLTVLFAGVTLGPIALRRPLRPPIGAAMQAVFLVLYLGGAALLARTAHEGGRLVHEFGVQSLMGG